VGRKQKAESFAILRISCHSERSEESGLDEASQKAICVENARQLMTSV
jgi:hypothetical protein